MVSLVLGILMFCGALINPVPANAAQGDCSQPVTTGAAPASSDCLFILQAAVGSRTCATECICDANGADGITGTDSLLCLQVAVGEPFALACDCPVVPPRVINEACAVCHAEGRIADVGVLHPGLQPIPDVDASIDSVTIDVDDMAMTATMTVDFTVTDPDGDYIADLGNASATRPDRFAYLRFALSELVPAAGGSGDPDSWVSLTTGDRTPTNLTDNGDGTYSYVMATNLYGLYDATLGQRLLLTVSGDIVDQSKNVTYDFVPAQLPGPFVFDITRDVVTTQACDSCHARLGSPLGSASFHGGSRYLAEGCVTCHTDTLGGEGAYFDFPRMVHKIHSAKVVNPDPEDLVDFSDVTLPQDTRNCAKCHAGVDGANWYLRPSRVACSACHDDVDFDTGENHPIGGIQLDNTQCVSCHSSDDIQEAHLTENSTPNNPEVPEGLVNFEYVIDSVTVNENNEAVVTFHINQDGAPVDLSTIPPAGFSGGPSFLVAYALPQDGVVEMIDYNQLGRSAGQPATVSLSSLAGTLTGTPAGYTAVLTAAAFPAGASLRAVALQGYFTQLGDDPDPSVTSDDTGRHTPSVILAATGDVERRQVVDSNKCLNCHEIIEGHGGNRVNNVQVCVTCHNPNLTSSGRVADATKTSEEQKDLIEAAGYDPENPLIWPEATQNFKDLIHGIHGAASRDFDFEFVRNRLNGLYYNWSEVTYPGILSNCETCHLSGTYEVEAPGDALVSTDITTDGLNLNQPGVQAARDSVPNDTDVISSYTAGTCNMCHDSFLAATHMEQNGGVLGGWRAEALGD